MTEAEMETLSVKLINLFNQAKWNEDLTDLWTRKLRGFEYADVIEAIEAHRAESTLNTPNLMAVTAKLLIARQKRGLDRREKLRVIDCLRREDRQSSRGQYIGWTDDQVLTAHFAKAWERVRDDARLEKLGRNFARAAILSHARLAFSEIGFAEKDADEVARMCVELCDGEQIGPALPVHVIDGARERTAADEQRIEEIGQAAGGVRAA